MGKKQRTVKQCQGQDFRPARGWNGFLKKKKQKKKLLANNVNYWYHYLKMEDKMTIKCHRFGASCKISPRGVKMMTTTKVGEQPKASQQELVNGLKATRTSFSQKTVGDTLRRNGLKFFSACNVALLKKEYV